MVRLRAFASLLAVALVMALAPGALAGPDPHGHGRGRGHGRPTPTPTVEPSPSPTPELPAPSAPPTPEATASRSPEATVSAEPQPSPREETPDDPPEGNAGVVKIDGRPFDTHPDDEPHVGCRFQLDFAGYPDGGVIARYAFSLWPPTGDGELVSGSLALEDDPAGGAGDVDGEVDVDLTAPILASGVDPHPIQGWHVKVVVRAPRSLGPDTKQKVFWVRRCGGIAPTASPTSSPTVLPTTVTPTETPPGPLAFTGVEVARLAWLALALLALGSGALRASARLRRST